MRIYTKQVGPYLIHSYRRSDNWIVFARVFPRRPIVTETYSTKTTMKMAIQFFITKYHAV